MPICRIRSACCARAASGHAASPPPTSVMNSRRLMGLPSCRTTGLLRLPHWGHICAAWQKLVADDRIGSRAHIRGTEWHVSSLADSGQAADGQDSKLVGRSRLCGQSMSGRHEPSFALTGGHLTWRCSNSLSTANCAAVTSSDRGARMSHLAGMRIDEALARGRSAKATTAQVTEAVCDALRSANR